MEKQATAIVMPPSDDRQPLIMDFLAKNSLADAEISLIAGDASFRKYYRLRKNGKSMVLMDAPPPHEKIEPFINVDKYLNSVSLKSPKIIIEDIPNGFLLLEDLGDDRYTRILDGFMGNRKRPSENELYTLAVDVLIKLQKAPIPANLPAYNNELLIRELLLFPDWYLPIYYNKDEVARFREEYIAIWNKILSHIHIKPQVVVLRDYHADNLMWITSGKGVSRVGLLDFQDAVIGSPAYDLVSLLEDARRDVSLDLTHKMLNYYLSEADFINKDEFLTSYALLGAQRNLKIVGIFSRLAKRDNKHQYLSFLPRVWGYINNDIKFPMLEELKMWLDEVVSSSRRNEVPFLASN